MRTRGLAPLPGLRYRDRPGVYAIILHDASMLVVEQYGEVMLPGGGLEEGERPLAALHREVWEETGWHVAPLRGLGTFQRYVWLEPYGYWCRKVEHLWLCRAVRQVGAPVERDHTPVLVPPSLALSLLAAKGERDAVARLMVAGAFRNPAARGAFRR